MNRLVDGLLDEGAEDGAALDTHLAAVVAAAVQVLEFAAGDRLTVDRGAVGNILDDEHNLAAARGVGDHLNHGGDGPRLPVDDEKEHIGRILGLGLDVGHAVLVALALEVGVQLVVVRDLGIDVGDAGGLEQGDGDIRTPRGGIAGSPQEDVRIERELVGIRGSGSTHRTVCLLKRGMERLCMFKRIAGCKMTSVNHTKYEYYMKIICFIKSIQ